MTNNSAKHTALKILVKNKLFSLNTFNNLKHIIESNQFTIIEYKKYGNSEPVSELIKKLRLENEIRQNDSFLYINNNLRIVFINEKLSDEDKCSLLRHELGHICDPDIKNNNRQNYRISREEFANEFSCYIKNPGIIFKSYLFIIKKRKLLAGLIALIACVLGLSVMIKSLITQPIKPVTGEVSSYTISDNTCYVTSSGKKFHRKNCIVVKYKNNLTQIKLKDAINSGYKPCMICSPE